MQLHEGSARGMRGREDGPADRTRRSGRRRGAAPPAVTPPGRSARPRLRCATTVPEDRSRAGLLPGREPGSAGSGSPPGSRRGSSPSSSRSPPPAPRTSPRMPAERRPRRLLAGDSRLALDRDDIPALAVGVEVRSHARVRPDVRGTRRVGPAVQENLVVDPQEPDRRGLGLTGCGHGREPEDERVPKARRRAGAGRRREVDHRERPDGAGEDAAGTIPGSPGRAADATACSP